MERVKGTEHIEIWKIILKPYIALSRCQEKALNSDSGAY